MSLNFLMVRSIICWRNIFTPSSQATD